MRIENYSIDIKRHALLRALKRGIDPDVLEAVIRSGRIEKFGKNYVRFIKNYN